MFSKTRVAVLRGGPSSEYEVSLRSGAAVFPRLTDKYDPLDIFIDRSGHWHLKGKKEEPHTILSKIDVVLSALHGEYGEDGKVQHLLETHHIPFTGSGRLASALAMNKMLAKDILGKQGIQTPYFKLIRKRDARNLESLAANLYRSFPQPAVIKPVAKGSSLGVSIAGTPADIQYALELAFQDSEAVLVEEFVPGYEVVCGVVKEFRGDSLYSLLPVEIRLPEGSPFFDYGAKYGGGSMFSSPGNLGKMEKAALQDLVKQVHLALGLGHYSSCDFIVHPTRGIYFLEVDTLPALGAPSPFLSALEAVGSSEAEFLDHIISLALARK